MSGSSLMIRATLTIGRMVYHNTWVGGHLSAGSTTHELRDVICSEGHE